MKLREYDKRDVLSADLEYPVVTVNPKSGVFTLNMDAMRITGLAEGESVTMLQDEEKPKDWYLRFTTAKTGFKLRADSKDRLKFSARTIARKLINTCYGKEVTHRIMLSAEKVENMWPIITHSGKEVVYRSKMAVK